MSYVPLNLTSTVTPASQDELTVLVSDAFQAGTPLYPIGGGTSLDYGLPPKQSGMGVVLTGLSRVIDFPARDLTITVEAGLTMQALAEVLATEGLRLPVDVPHPNRATLGGVIATAWSGPRRFGHGSIRDFVIGIRAVDGRGTVFNGGGRVVKNVAGYDFCKLLTGSLGTIGIISQVTLKLRPLAQQTTAVCVPLSSLASTDELLATLSTATITPTAIEYCHRAAKGELIVLLEGTTPEVEWSVVELQNLIAQHGAHAEVVATGQTSAVINELTHGPAASAPLVIKASVRPSALTKFVAGVLDVDAQATIHAHAGNGIVYASFAEFPKQGLSRTIIGKLQPLASSLGGHVVILANPSGLEATPQSTWGALGGQQALMTAVKEQFDPRNILNPGRFVF